MGSVFVDVLSRIDEGIAFLLSDIITGQIDGNFFEPPGNFPVTSILIPRTIYAREHLLGKVFGLLSMIYIRAQERQHAATMSAHQVVERVFVTLRCSTN